MAAQRGTYTVSFSEQTIASASGNYDLFELVPADDRPIELVALSLGNKSEVQDAQDEMLSINVITDNTSGSDGTATTPRPLDPRDGAAGFSAETLGPAVGSGGTPITVICDTFNVRGGLMWIFPEIMRPKVDQGDTAMYIRLTSAAADDLTLSGTAWVRSSKPMQLFVADPLLYLAPRRRGAPIATANASVSQTVTPAVAGATGDAPDALISTIETALPGTATANSAANSAGVSASQAASVALANSAANSPASVTDSETWEPATAGVTGAVPASGASATFAAGVGQATGTSADPTALTAVIALAEIAGATGDAPDAVQVVASIAVATVAPATGDAPDAVQVATSATEAGTASATGDAPDPTALTAVAAPADTANTTGDAPDPTFSASVAITAGIGQAAGHAYDAVVLLVDDESVTALAAEATGTAGNASIRVDQTITAGTGSATGTASATCDVSFALSSASATGQAYDAATVSGTLVVAGVAASTGQVDTTRSGVHQLAAVALAEGGSDGADAVDFISVTAGTAFASGQANSGGGSARQEVWSSSGLGLALAPTVYSSAVTTVTPAPALAWCTANGGTVDTEDAPGPTETAVAGTAQGDGRASQPRSVVAVRPMVAGCTGRCNAPTISTVSAGFRLRAGIPTVSVVLHAGSPQRVGNIPGTPVRAEPLRVGVPVPA